ncbi:hypothetical protein Hanom_Chr17g01538551 [Helianthus anomalus]
MSNQTSQWNGMIYFIPLSIPLPRTFHSLIYSITSYQTDSESLIIVHQYLTLHQMGIEHASLKKNVNLPPLNLEIIA